MRYPIEYNYNADSENKREDIQKSLVDTLKTAIRDVAIYALQHYKTRFQPFLAWELWQNYVPKDQRFIANGKIEEIYRTIKQAVKDGNQIIRVLGLSGLGKTRIIFELFRPLDDEESKKLSGRALYLDCNENSEINLAARIEEILQSKNEHLIILDNCQPEICRTMKTRIAQHSAKVSLITIDNNPEEQEQNFITGVKYITIGKDDLRDVVDEIIKTDFSDLPAESVEKIREFSQGIPLMAVLLGESAKKGERFIGKLDDKDLLDKLLGEFGKEKEHKNLLRTSALFNVFGYENDLEPQFRFLATNQNLTVTNNQPLVSEKLFREVIEHYKARQIFEPKGRLLGMRPFPLAMYLAEEWLDQCTDERLHNVIIALAQMEQPHGRQLSEALAEQMKYLGFSPKANQIVERLTDDGAPFDNAEVLNTELGSRLFRAFVQVNPVATVQALYRNYANRPAEELRLVEEGRRNLVWALETLCFDGRTYIDAAKVLAGFALAENENWSNNATGTFLHHFNIHLSGTEAKLADRLAIINWLWEKDNLEYKDLAIMAMSRALNFGHFSRMGGAEKQGTKVLKDNEPTDKEVVAYWQAIIGRLQEIYFLKNKFSAKAAEVLLDRLRMIASAGKGDLILQVVEAIAKDKGNDWDEALRPLKTMLKYERPFLSEHMRQVGENLILSLTKDDFLSKFARLVSNPQMDLIEDYSFENKEKKIEELAREFAESTLDWNNVIPIMVSGYPYSAFIFGRTLTTLWGQGNPKLFEFITHVIKSLQSIDKEARNWTILGGIYQTAEPPLRTKIIDQLLAKSELSYILFGLIPMSRTAFEDATILFKLVDFGQCAVAEFVAFAQYGFVVTNPEQLAAFCRKLFRYGKEGYQIAFKIAQTASFFNEKHTEVLLPLLKECILKIGIVNPELLRSDQFQWWEITRKILYNTQDVEFAVAVNNAIIESITWENSYHLDTYIQSLYGVLIGQYFKEVWPRISENLLVNDEDFVKFYGLKHILGSSNGAFRHSKGILFLGDLDTMLHWSREHLPLAPIRLANLTPIFADREENATKASWHPVARRLIDEFGTDIKVLNELSANMGSFSWTGSVIPYLQMQKDLMEAVAKHPIAEVQDWSKQAIQAIDKQIKNERDRDEEMNIH
ncbi:MAG TPA: hypothetical protein VFE53_25230 [Mucilaginibacter sp.]|nr:hypothetical protein [Mucilaginibacter sp.]